MFRTLRLVGFGIPLLAVGLTLVACGTSGSNAAGNKDCSKVTSCYELCVCASGDMVQCAPACGVPIPTGGSGGGSGGNPVGGSGGVAVGGAGGTPSGDLAAGLTISEIDLYQGLKLQLMANGTEGNKASPPVADREGRIRVWVTPDGDFQPREVVARIELGGSGAGVFEGKQYIGGASFEGDQNTTINIDIPQNALKPDATYVISLHETTPGTTFPGNQGGAQWPTTGPIPMGVQSTNGVFNVVLVPVIVNGIAPDMGPNRIQAYKDRLMKLYPIPDVNIEVREQAIYNGATPQALSTQGWDSLLDWLMQLRSFDKPQANRYYYGVFTPTNSFFQFCPGGCIAGLSNAPADYPGAQNDILARTGTGLGFFNSDGNPGSSDTAAHEIGHTLGLNHAPCSQFGGIQGVDPNFPQKDANIGNWGFDIITKNLIEPSGYTDIMAYCDPSWISDYHYSKIFNRVAYANSTGDQLVTDPERLPGLFKTAIVHDDGTLTWGTTKDVPYPISAEKREIDVLDASGKVVGKVSGFFYPVDHSKGGFLYVREKLVADSPAAHTLKAAGLAPIVLK